MSETAEAPAAHDFISKTVAENDVVLFMKGFPDQPGCGFSAIVVQILDHLGVAFAGVNVLQNDALRQGIKAYSDWPTIPQLYVKGNSSADAISSARCSSQANSRPCSTEQGLLVARASRPYAPTLIS